MFLTAEELFESGEVGHASVEGLETGVRSVDSVTTDLLGEFDVLEKNEISDAGNLITTEEVLSAHVLGQSCEVIHELLGGNGLVFLPEASHKRADEVLIGDELESVPEGALCGSLTEHGGAELLRNVLMDSEGLGDDEITDLDVGQVGEFHAKGVLGILPFVLSDDIGLLLIGDLGVVKHVASRIASAGATEVPVTESHLASLFHRSPSAGR